MSWMSRQCLIWRSQTEPNAQMPIQSSELRQGIGLKWSLNPGDELMSTVDIGRGIDHCLVEFTSIQLQDVKAEKVKVEEFIRYMLRSKHLMREDKDLMDFAETLNRREQPFPLASEIYIELACRHVLSDQTRSPSFEWGHQFARVMLDQIHSEELWQHDWDRETTFEDLAIFFLEIRYPQQRQNFVDESKRSPYVWDALKWLCKVFDDAGKMPPIELQRWAIQVVSGQLKRPSEGLPIPNRPRMFGQMIRDNEIRHTVYLLGQVGMAKTQAYMAVGEALGRSHRTIERINRKPYSTVVDLLEHMTVRLNSILAFPRVN